jgi:hypothetical protein
MILKNWLSLQRDLEIRSFLGFSVWDSAGPLRLYFQRMKPEALAGSDIKGG